MHSNKEDLQTALCLACLTSTVALKYTSNCNLVLLHCAPRSVALLQTNPGLAVKSRGDIIAFYNTSFVPAMKMFLLKGSAGVGLPPMHPGGNGKLLSPGGGLIAGKPTSNHSAGAGTPGGSAPTAAGTASPTPTALMAHEEGGLGQHRTQQQQVGCPSGPPPRSSVAGFFPSLPRATSSPTPQHQPLASPVPGAGGSAFQPYSAGGRTPVGLPKPPTPGHSKPPLHPSPPTQAQQRSGGPGGGPAGGLMSLVMAAAAASKGDTPQAPAAGATQSAGPSPRDSITRSPSPAASAPVQGPQESQPAPPLPARSPSPGFTFTVITSLAQLPPEVAAAAAAGNPTAKEASQQGGQPASSNTGLLPGCQAMTAAATQTHYQQPTQTV
jgi:hypothetical protein